MNGVEEKDDMLMGSRKKAPARVLPVLILVVISGIHAITTGMMAGYASPSGAEMMGDERIDKDEMSWYGSLPFLGTVFGSLTNMVTAQRLGRKGSLIMLSFPCALGWGLIVLALQTGWTGPTLLGLIYTGRFLQGIAAGFTITGAPVYVAECASKELRGRLTCSTTVFWQTGVLTMFALSIGLEAKWTACFPMIMSLLAAGLLCCLPESPALLLAKHKEEEARKALIWLRGEDFDIDGEIREKRGRMDMEQKKKAKFGFKDMAKRTFFIPALIGVPLAIIQFAGGIVIVVTYSIQILQEAGFKSKPMVLAVISAAVLLVFSIVPVTLADKAGRRLLLLVSTAVCSLCFVVLGLYFYLTEVKGYEGLVAMSVTSIGLYFASWSCGLGSMVFVVLGEMFPLQARGAGTGMAIFFAFLLCFITIKEFPSMQRTLKPYGTFWFFAGMNLVGTLISAFFLPETKGKSLEEIEEYFKGKQKQDLSVTEMETKRPLKGDV